MEVKAKENPLREKFVLPHIGQRIIKTSIAVFICLLIAYIFRGTGWSWSVADSCVAVIICIQPSKGDSFKESLFRFYGVLLGDVCGLLMLLILWNTPIFGEVPVLSYLLMSLGIGVALYLCVALKLTNAAGLCAIIYISIIATYPKVHTPFETAWNILVGTVIGIAVASFVDDFKLAGEKHTEYLFFIRLQDLVPDRYAHVASNVHVILNRLFDDGAKICLTTRWAPAFLMSQMGAMKVNAPAIVMDGAAIYDIASNKYLKVVDIPHADADLLTNQLKAMHLSYAVIAVNEQSLLIYRSAYLNWAEEQEYKVMMRSPYRNYVDGSYVKEDKIAVIRLMALKTEMDQLEEKLRAVVGDRLRIDRRQMPGISEYEGLFFTSPEATIEKRMVDVTEGAVNTFKMGITPVSIVSPYKEYKSVNDAIQILHKVRSQFEPSYIRDKFFN